MNDSTKELVSEKIEQTVEAASEVVRHPYIKTLALLGFYTKAFLFIVIGMLAVMVALGDREDELSDPTGALSRIAIAPFGKAFLIIFIVGAIGHGVWNILRGVADVDNCGKKIQGIIKRCAAVGIGIFYLFLAWTAWSIIITAQVTVENGNVQKSIIALLLALPFGALLVGLIGLIIIGTGFQQCYSGITGKFLETFKVYKIEGYNRKIIDILGYLSFVARALIFVMIGYFFIWAAIHYNPNEAIGIDGALLLLSRNYFGKTLLFVTAFGLVCHGILSLYEAKYRRIS